MADLSQTLTAVIAGCEAAWAFFGGAFRVLIPDNLKAVVTDPDAINPRLSKGWLDYTQHVRFGTDPARVRSPQDKPRVERAVQYVRGNFWAGETSTDLADAQARVEAWCRERAGCGSTAPRNDDRPRCSPSSRPAVCCRSPSPTTCRPSPGSRCTATSTSRWPRRCYSVPTQFLGHYLDARVDSPLVKLYSPGRTAGPAGEQPSGRLVKTHPRQPAGGRSTDRENLPTERTGYALRDLTRLVGDCASHGPNIGIYAERLLDDPLPWTKMRSVYRLLGLVRRYGPEPVDAACSRSLDLDVVSVSKIAAMLAKAREREQPVLPAAAGSPGGRFARDPSEYSGRRSVQLTLIPGGAAAAATQHEGDHR